MRKGARGTRRLLTYYALRITHYAFGFPMPQKYTGRIILIAAVVIVAVLAIFPPGTLFKPGLTWGQRLNLKPGIDMVGGASLLYEIKLPEGTAHEPGLANQMMRSLKKRVDPQ